MWYTHQFADMSVCVWRLWAVILNNYCKYTNKSTVKLHLSGRQLSGLPFIQIGLALRGNLLRIIKTNFPWNTGYRIMYSTVLWLLELQIRCGRKVQTQVHTVKSNSRTSNCQFSLYSKKNPIIQMLCISGWLAIQINLDKWSSTVFLNTCLLTFLMVR